MPAGRWIDSWKESVNGLMTNTVNPKLLPVEVAWHLMMGPIHNMLRDTPTFALDNDVGGNPTRPLDDGYDETLAHYRHKRGNAGHTTLVSAHKRPKRSTLLADLTKAQSELTTTYETLMTKLREETATLETRREGRTSRLT